MLGQSDGLPDLASDLTAREVAGPGVGRCDAVVRVDVRVRVAGAHGVYQGRQGLAGQRTDQVGCSDRALGEQAVGSAATGRGSNVTLKAPLGTSTTIASSTPSAR